MITLYGRTYAANDKEAVSSLFQPHGTVNGFYRKERAGIYLSDLQGHERVFIRADGFGPVSTFRDDSGRRRYAHSTHSMDDKWLNVPESYSATCDGARQLAASLYRAEVTA